MLQKVFVVVVEFAAPPGADNQNNRVSKHGHRLRVRDSKHRGAVNHNPVIFPGPLPQLFFHPLGGEHFGWPNLQLLWIWLDSCSDSHRSSVAENLT